MIAFCFIILCITSSCNHNFAKGNFSEVDFSKEVKINVEYNFEVFDALLSYRDGCLNFRYCDNCGTMSGTEVTINSKNYTIKSNELEFGGNINELNDSFLPLLVYGILSENNGSIKAQMYDEKKECCYFEESVSSKFFRFEVYESNKASTYVIIVT